MNPVHCLWTQYYKNKMESLDPSREPERYSRNEEKLFSVQAAVVEETKSLIHDVSARWWRMDARVG